MPSWLRTPVLWISGASLFIYMLHGRAPIDSFTSGWPVDVIRVGAGIVLGIIAWHAYNWGMSIVMAAWRRARLGW